MRSWTALVMVAACGPELPIPREPMPIHWVRRDSHGNYEKGGAALDGFTCGERYQAAVAGVPEALDEMRACARLRTAYGILMPGSLVLPLATSFAFDGMTRRDRAVQITGLAVGVAAFLVGFVLVSPLETEHEKRAIRLYNDRVLPR